MRWNASTGDIVGLGCRKEFLPLPKLVADWRSGGRLTGWAAEPTREREQRNAAEDHATLPAVGQRG
eukprot:12122364-Alexandrium_andersonii.AAC.1